MVAGAALTLVDDGKVQITGAVGREGAESRGLCPQVEVLARDGGVPRRRRGCGPLVFAG
jgi:hypothetical protein